MIEGISIKKLEKEDIKSASILIKETYKKYNSEDIVGGKNGKFFEFFNYEKNKNKLIEFFNNSKSYVAKNKNKEIIGIIRFHENRIQSFFVRTDYQNKGIGKKLFSIYINEIKGKYKFAFVFASNYGIKIYKALGFKESGKKFLRGGEIRVQPMKLEIQQKI